MDHLAAKVSDISLRSWWRPNQSSFTAGREIYTKRNQQDLCTWMQSVNHSQYNFKMENLRLCTQIVRIKYCGINHMALDFSVRVLQVVCYPPTPNVDVKMFANPLALWTLSDSIN